MKFRRTMSAICSSALVLGLTFLLYPQNRTANISGPVPTVTPSGDSMATPTPDVSVAPTQTATITPTNAPFVHPLLTDDLTTPSAGVTDLVTAYINGYYKNDIETISSLVTEPSLLNENVIKKNTDGVTNVDDIKLYAKPGINGIFSVVYATYSLSYGNDALSMPQFSEYYIKRSDDGSYLIHIAALPTETREMMTNARESEPLLNLAISALIRRYNNACLIGDEQLLKQCVTDSDYLNMDYFESRFAYTEHFTDYEFIIHPGINEFDYIVYVTYNEKIVLIDTPAPCMECYYIYLDPSTNRPYIYLGITSLDTDAYCAAVTQREDIQALAAATDQAMTDALLSDDDLKDFYNRLTNNSSTQ